MQSSWCTGIYRSCPHYLLNFGDYTSLSKLMIVHFVHTSAYFTSLLGFIVWIQSQTYCHEVMAELAFTAAAGTAVLHPLFARESPLFAFHAISCTSMLF